MKRVPGLDVLRSIAILMVMMSHYRRGDGDYIFGYVGQSGRYGVDLFFCLSGYLIGNQLFLNFKNSTFSWMNFYQRRILRTWPSYLAMVIFYFSLSRFRDHPDMPSLWKFLTFTQNFGLTFSPFSHAWSLCIEEQFYLTLPLIGCLLYKKGTVRLNSLFICGLIIFGVLIRANLWLDFVNTVEGVNLREYYRMIYYPTWSRLDGLLLGVSLAALINFKAPLWEKINQYYHATLIVGIFLVVICCNQLDNRFLFEPTLFAFPFLSLGFTLCVVSALNPASLLNRFKIPGAFELSTLAYALYLVHKEVFTFAGEILQKWGMLDYGILTTIIFFSLSVFVAILLYMGVERPFLHLRDRLSH